VLSSQYTGGSNAGGQGNGTNSSGTLSGSDRWLLYGAGLGAGSSASGAGGGSSLNLLVLLSQYKEGSSAGGQDNGTDGPLTNADLWIFHGAGAGAGSSSGSTSGSLTNDPAISAQYTGGSGIGRITPLVYQFGSDDGPGFHSGGWTSDDGGVQFVTVSEDEGAPPPKPDAAAASVGLFDWWRNLWRGEAKPATPPVDQPRGADIPAVGLPDQLPAIRPDGTLDPVLNNTIEKATPNNGLGPLVTVDAPDPAADALARRLGGEPRVRFANGPTNEFDVVSDLYIAQSKPADFTLNKAFRDQAKVTFEVALKTGRIPYFHFEGSPHRDVLRKIDEYARRFGIEPIIDVMPLN
jgi:Restriction endonuclease fold toxin 3